ncbi:LuxR C-terminal-related transcriptional regulator [Leifsonia sp. fls2-241-R2A-40a]|uniref:helix-turn-helix transcriptional regulator n=1 Tax=Leifsonia sp. fls2-241-R2A-40a TaxID=3040290 RepID=UPI0025501D7E|nr:LuxR C-terminal-related transcriptional regulator [Leifsonia sp. fls2-241-R2A-40a]
MEADDRNWMRDLGALLALPSLWVDHSPGEIADGLLSVLVGVLRLDAAYARFQVPEGGELIEVWRPSGVRAPAPFADVLRSGVAAEDGEPSIAFPEAAAGFTTAAVRTTDVPSAAAGAITRVASLALALPWESARVLVAASRPDFPTDRETHLLRVAVGQAAIALHTARRLASEQRARREAEAALERQAGLLRSLLEEVGPALTVVARRVRQVSREATETVGPPLPVVGPVPVELPVAAAGAGLSPESPAQPLAAKLTGRELEVLGLLAQGLSNKEIAGVMWLSDRTVERHITSLYRKIGVGRRSEATAFALRHGVV